MSRARAGKGLLAAAVVAIALLLGAAYALSHCDYVPREPLAVSRRFIDLVQAGSLAEAYRLTTERGAVGGNLEEFQSRIRRQLGIGDFPTHRAVALVGITSGRQSYGNRLRRWLTGRKLDPDEIGVDYVVEIPFEIRLVAEGGTWRIVFFQSHAA